MIRLEHISKSYFINGNKIDILKDVNFEINENGLYFIMGKSGSGKSTLLNIIENVLTQDDGKIYIDNKEIYFKKEKERVLFFKRYIGIIFQHYNLFNELTIKENIDLTISLKENVDISYIENLKEQLGLKEIYNQKVDTLSGGEKQRVAILRAMVNRPSIILCDEPTGALDEENSNILMNELKKISKDSIILVVTHNEDLTNKFSDKTYILEDGNLYEKK